MFRVYVSNANHSIKGITESILLIRHSALEAMHYYLKVDSN